MPAENPIELHAFFFHSPLLWSHPSKGAAFFVILRLSAARLAPLSANKKIYSGNTNLSDNDMDTRAFFML